jgi:hypothetical protein
MLTYAMDTPPPETLILISGDRDFAYAVSTLRLRQYHVVLLAPSITHASLKAHASAFIDWNCEILGKNLGSSSDAIQGSIETMQDPQRKPVPVPDPADAQFPSSTFSHWSQLTPGVDVVARTTIEERRQYERSSAEEQARAGFPKESAPAQTFAPQTTNILSSVRNPAAAATVRAWHKDSPTHNATKSDPFPKYLPSEAQGHSHGWTQVNAGFRRGPPTIYPVESLVQNSHASVSLSSPNSAFTGETSRHQPETVSSVVAPTAVKTFHFTSPSSFVRHPAVPNIPVTSSLPGETPLPGSSISSHWQSTRADTKEGKTALNSPSTWTHSAVPPNTSEPFPHLQFGQSQDSPKPTSGGVKLGCSSAADEILDVPLSSVRERQTSTTQHEQVGRRSTPVQIKLEETTSPKSSSAAASPPAKSSDILTPPPPVAKFASNPSQNSDETRPIVKFAALVECLKKEQTNGNVSALRSKVGTSLYEHDKLVYQRAGVTTFREYAALAEAAGVVKMGGQGGSAWIALHADLQMEQIPSLSSHSSGPSTMLLRRSPPEFALLVDLLKQEHLKGNPRASRSTISIALIQQDSLIYKRAGVTRFSHYTAIAEKSGIIQMGGKEGDAWISLHPDWRD